MSYYPGDDGELDVFLSTFDRIGSGGVYAPLNDMIRWDRNFHDASVGGKQVIDWMHETRALNDGTENNYAWGITLGEHRGLKTVTHTGGLGGYRTILARYPALATTRIANEIPAQLADECLVVDLERAGQGG